MQAGLGVEILARRPSVVDDCRIRGNLRQAVGRVFRAPDLASFAVQNQHGTVGLVVMDEIGFFFRASFGFWKDVAEHGRIVVVGLQVEIAAQGVVRRRFPREAVALPPEARLPVSHALGNPSAKGVVGVFRLFSVRQGDGFQLARRIVGIREFASASASISASASVFGLQAFSVVVEELPVAPGGKKVFVQVFRPFPFFGRIQVAAQVVRVGFQIHRRPVFRLRRIRTTFCRSWFPDKPAFPARRRNSAVPAGQGRRFLPCA